MTTPPETSPITDADWPDLIASLAEQRGIARAEVEQLRRDGLDPRVVRELTDPPYLLRDAATIRRIARASVSVTDLHAIGEGIASRFLGDEKRPAVDHVLVGMTAVSKGWTVEAIRSWREAGFRNAPLDCASVDPALVIEALTAGVKVRPNEIKVMAESGIDAGDLAGLSQTGIGMANAIRAHNAGLTADAVSAYQVDSKLVGAAAFDRQMQGVSARDARDYGNRFTASEIRELSQAGLAGAVAKSMRNIALDWSAGELIAARDEGINKDRLKGIVTALGSTSLSSVVEAHRTGVEDAALMGVYLRHGFPTSSWRALADAGMNPDDYTDAVQEAANYVSPTRRGGDGRAKLAAQLAAVGAAGVSPETVGRLQRAGVGLDRVPEVAASGEDAWAAGAEHRAAWSAARGGAPWPWSEDGAPVPSA